MTDKTSADRTDLIALTDGTIVPALNSKTSYTPATPEKVYGDLPMADGFTTHEIVPRDQLGNPDDEDSYTIEADIVDFSPSWKD
jgi:hypothetical protein